MKKSIFIKISLSALAIMVSMPMKGEAMQAWLQAQAQAQALAQQQAQVPVQQPAHQVQAPQPVQVQAPQPVQVQAPQPVQVLPQQQVQQPVQQVQALQPVQQVVAPRQAAQALAQPQQQALSPAQELVKNAYVELLISWGNHNDVAHNRAEKEIRTFNPDRLKTFAQHFARTYLFNAEGKDFLRKFNGLLINPEQKAPPVTQPLIQVPAQQIQAPVALTPEQRLSQSIRGDLARFRFLNTNSEEEASETSEFRIRTLIHSFGKNLPKDDNEVLFFAEKVCQDGGADNRVNTRITRARHVFLIMKAINPALNNDFDEGAYQIALRQRCHLYQYMDYKTLDRYNTPALTKAISDLKGLLNKKENEALEFYRNFTFETAINLAKAQEAFTQDQKDINKAFKDWQGFLKAKANPENGLYKLQASDIHGIQGNWALDEDGHVFDLLQEWGEVTGEIDCIAHTKRNDPVRLNYKKLTYQDSYSALFNTGYPVININQINEIKDDIIRAATAEHQAGMLTDIGLEDLKEQAELNFDSIIKFDHLSNDRDHFKARAYLIYTILPEAIVLQGMARPEEGEDNKKWDEALTTAKYTIGDQLVMSLANCEAGVNRKLGNLEDKFKDILGTLEPQTSGIKAVASIVKEIKLNRINELGRNADLQRVEYNLNAPHVAKQRLRGPLSLGGDYETCSSAGLGCPFMAQNLPIQVIHNMFLPNQPAHTYYHGQAENENRNDEWNPIVPDLPVKEHLTVKRLVEAVYNEFELQTGYDQDKDRPIMEGRITKRHIDSLLNSDFFHTEDISNAVAYDMGTVFLQNRDGKEKARGPRDLYTREMAFYLLERLGYVEINENIKKDVYQFDFDDKEVPGTTMHAGLLPGGKGKTLKDLIDEY